MTSAGIRGVAAAAPFKLLPGGRDVRLASAHPKLAATWGDVALNRCSDAIYYAANPLPWLAAVLARLGRVNGIARATASAARLNTATQRKVVW